MQINNLLIRFKGAYRGSDKGVWQVISPNKRVLEEFGNLLDAQICAKGITDFVKIGGKVQQ